MTELGEKKPEDFANSLLLADFQASLQHAAELLERESRHDEPPGGAARPVVV
jgi:hypothetical protein